MAAKIHYGIGIMPYTNKQIAKLDSILCSGAKSAMQLQRSTGSAYCTRGMDQGGLGAHSILVEAATQAGQIIIQGTNNDTHVA